MKILAWDIEMTPMTTYTWSLYPSFIGIDQIVKPQEMMSFSARWVGSKKNVFYSTHHNSKEEMLKALWELMDEADALVSWNGAGFDTKHANREFIEAGMAPPSPCKEIDLMKVAKKNFKFPSNKLDYVARTLGVGQKTQHTGFQLWLDCMAGDEKAWRLMRKYNKQDVDLLIELYEKLLPWIKMPHPAHEGDDKCRNCGGERLQRRGSALTLNGTYHRVHCQDCGAWGRLSSRTPSTNVSSI